MYDADALLDELEDVVTPHSEEEEEEWIELNSGAANSLDAEDEEDTLSFPLAKAILSEKVRM